MSKEIPPSPEEQQFYIQPADVTDTSAVAALVASRWVDTYHSREHGVDVDSLRRQARDMVRPDGIIAFMKDIREASRRQEYYCKVARDAKGQLVGYMHGSKPSFEQANLHALYVSKKHEQTGVGTALMEDFLNWVGPNRNIEVEVARYNIPALRFYGNKYKFGLVRGSGAIKYGKIPVVTLRREGEKSDEV